MSRARARPAPLSARAWMLDLCGGTARLHAGGTTPAVTVAARETVRIDPGGAAQVALGRLLARIAWMPAMPARCEVARGLGRWLAGRLELSGPGLCLVPPAFPVWLRRELKQGLSLPGVRVLVCDGAAALLAGALAEAAPAQEMEPGHWAVVVGGPGGETLLFAVWPEAGAGGAPMAVALPAETAAPERTNTPRWRGGRTPPRRVKLGNAEGVRRRGAALLVGALPGGGAALELHRTSLLGLQAGDGSRWIEVEMPDGPAPCADAFEVDLGRPPVGEWRLFHRFADRPGADCTPVAEVPDALVFGTAGCALRVDLHDAAVTLVPGGSAPPGDAFRVRMEDAVPPAVL